MLKEIIRGLFARFGYEVRKIPQNRIDATDFVYSNSFDHSYDPEKCLNAWMSCLKKGGICILEHTSQVIKLQKWIRFTPTLFKCHT